MALSGPRRPDVEGIVTVPRCSCRLGRAGIAQPEDGKLWLRRGEAAALVSHAGRWMKLRVRCAAFSTAITKHTRSGPRLGNGAPVYLTEIGSM